MCSSDLFPSHDILHYKNPDYIKNEVVPELVENNPCYQQSVYDTVMYDESLDGDLIQCDMTQILLNQEKYRRLLGDMNVQNVLAQMHPTQSTVMDGMTDEERFDCVISRHCQTMSERQSVLQQLASEKSELSAMLLTCSKTRRLKNSSTSYIASVN